MGCSFLAVNRDNLCHAIVACLFSLPEAEFSINVFDTKYSFLFLKNSIVYFAYSACLMSSFQVPVKLGRFQAFIGLRLVAHHTLRTWLMFYAGDKN